MAVNRIPCRASRLLAACLFAAALWGSEHRGTVKSAGIPIPGATVTAVQDGRKFVTTTNGNGVYVFADLVEGTWRFEIEMLGFAKAAKEVAVSTGAPAAEWELKLQTVEQIRASLAPAAAPAGAVAAPVAGSPVATGPAAAVPPAAAASKPASKQARDAGSAPVRGRQGQGQRGEFQRVDVNQSGDLAAAGDEWTINSETAADLSQSANNSLLVNGSVSRGLELPQMPDWFGGRGGGMEGFGPGMGPGMGMNPGLAGLNGDVGPGTTVESQPLAAGPGGRGGGPGMGPGGRGGPGGGMGPGGGGRGGPAMMGGGGRGGAGGGLGGRGGRGGRGGPAFANMAGVAAFGNARRDRRMQYNANLGFVLGNSVWDAQSYSVTGNKVEKPAYANARMNGTLGGPLRIPHLLSGERGQFTLNVAVNRSRNGITQTWTVPTALERAGDFSQSVTQRPVAIYDPDSGNPFPENRIPAARLSPTSLQLANFYPLPNFIGTNRNYTASIVRVNNSVNVNTRLNQTLSRTDRVMGGIGYQDGDNTNPNLFQFIDTGASRGLNANVGWAHNFTTRIISNLNYRFSRNRNLNSPYFSFVRDIEGELGITGASTAPINWGPPTLSFTQGIASLSDGNASLSRDQTSTVSESLIWIHGVHNMTFGAEFTRRQTNRLADSNARGTFTFSGAVTSLIANGIAVQGTGFDFADFVLGLPATSSVNYGNADKYFRTSSLSFYANDDWRVSTRFSVNGGIRWDYQSPITELYGRLVNLDIAPGYTAIQPVLPGQVGPLSGMRYPDSLVYPDRNNFSPRIGFAWRPFTRRSTRVNAGYGLYFNSAAYATIANNMAAQPPFAQNFSVATTPENPLTIQHFSAGANTITNTRAIDPFYRIGYAQIWQLSIQNDFGRAFFINLTLNHTKGTGLDQQFLPNSLPPQSKDTPAGPAGYIYQKSNGNSSYNSAQIQLSRRFRGGLSGSVSYILSKAIDNGGIGTLIAQNWLALDAERALSNFDARHTMNAQWQYTSGMGLSGARMHGWKAALLRGWSIMNSITVRTGNPFTANAGGNRAVVGGTGVSGPVRADATGLALEDADPGYGFNINAFAVPIAGRWGSAGRNTIPGPRIFSLNGSIGRNIRLAERRNMDIRFDVTNALNHVTITNWGTTISSSTFGLPTSAAGMRRINASVRFRF
jgi:hypothetical protein